MFDAAHDFDFDFDFDAPEDAVENSKAAAYVKVDMPNGTLKVFQEGDVCYAPAVDVDEAVKRVSEIKDKLEPMNSQVKEFNAQIEEIRARMQAEIDTLTQQREAIRVEMFDLQVELRKAEQAYLNAMRNLERALEAQRLSEEYKKKSSEFDDLTLKMPWHDRILPHQIEGAKQLAIAGRAILADTMGLGKSLTSLATMDMLAVKRLLIIVPDDVVSNFTHEAHYWAPHRNVIMMGKQPKMVRNMMVDLLSATDEFTVVINYSAWRRDKSLIEKLISLRFEAVIMDEAHTIKETSSNAYLGCKEIVLANNSCPECFSATESKRHTEDIIQTRTQQKVYHGRYSFVFCKSATCGWSEIRDIEREVKRPAGYQRSVKYVIPMTGTPILNKPSDIFAPLSLVQPEVYHNKNQFIRDFCYVDYDNKVRFKPGGMDSLVKKLSGRYIARDRKSAGVVLPKQTVVYHNIEIDPEVYRDQYRVIQQLTKHAAVMLNSGKQMPVFATIALITRKRQANVWPAGIVLKDEDGDVIFNVGDEVQESIKLDRLCNKHGEGMIPDLTAEGSMTIGERVVVFSQFKEPLKELEKRLDAAGISVVRFDGDTPQDIRDQVKRDFDRKFCDAEGYEPKWQVVLCNYKTGGVGLNFTGATQMIVLDQEWNPGKENQAFGRIDRMGQTEETTVHVLQIERTIDTWMHNLVEEKRDMIDGFDTANNLQQMLAKSMTDGTQI